jgi:hypothetical protein
MVEFPPPPPNPNFLANFTLIKPYIVVNHMMLKTNQMHQRWCFVILSVFEP